MKKIRLKGPVVSSAVQSGDNVINEEVVKKKLQGIKDDIEVDLTTDGGQILEAFNVVNYIEQWKSQTGRTANVFINGFVASAGTYIALAFDNIKVSNSSIVMIHNPSVVMKGTAKQLNESAKMLDNIAQISIRKYANKMNKTEKEIQQYMDSETSFYGKEIKEVGFATEYVDEGVTSDTVEQKVVIENYIYDQEQLNKLISLYNTNSIQNSFENEVVEEYEQENSNNNMELIDNMQTVEMLKRDNLELYTKIYNEGYNARSNEVDAHLTWIKEVDNMDIVLNAITNKEVYSVKHSSMYHVHSLRNKVKNNFNEDMVEKPAVTLPNVDQVIDNNVNNVNNVNNIEDNFNASNILPADKFIEQLNRGA